MRTNKISIGGNATWGARTQSVLEGAYLNFFPETYGGNIMSEIECEAKLNCNSDESSFKAYLSRWMAVSSVIAPFLAPDIVPKLQASAMGAAGQCIGGDNGRMCGRQWYSPTWDGTQGVGQQMSALSVVGANLITSAVAPKNVNTGATSQGDPNAGSSAASGPTGIAIDHITVADKAGASILTVLIIFGFVGGSWWLCV